MLIHQFYKTFRVRKHFLFSFKHIIFNAKVIVFRRLIIGFVLLWFLTMGAFTGLVFGVIEFTKDTKIHDSSNGKGGAALVTMDDAHIVQTASSEFS